MSENLYQLRTAALPGQHVIIDGPHDRYGKVIKHRESGYHLIRGLGMEQPGNVSSFASVQNG